MLLLICSFSYCVSAMCSCYRMQTATHTVQFIFNYEHVGVGLCELLLPAAGFLRYTVLKFCDETLTIRLQYGDDSSLHRGVMLHFAACNQRSAGFRPDSTFTGANLLQH